MRRSLHEGDAEKLAKQLLDAVESNTHAPTGDDERMRLEAAEAGGRRLRHLIARTPWAFIPPAWLDEIETAFDPVIADLKAYADADDAIPLAVTWREIERMWASLLPLVPAALPEESVSEDATAFRRSAAQLIRRLSDHVEQAKGEVAKLQTQVQELGEEREAQAARLKAEVESLETTIAEQSDRLEQAIRSNQEQFSAAQERHRQEFSDQLAEFQTALANARKEAERETTLAVDNMTAEGRERLKDIEAIEEKATKSYNVIGTASVAGHFQNDAENEHTQAVGWRFAAVAGFLLIGLGAVIELLASGGSLGWAETRSRIPVVLALGAFAAYAVAEARNHRRAERESRRREVELSSIDPFLVLVEDRAEAEKIKLDYARRVFVEQGITAPDHDEEPPSP